MQGDPLATLRTAATNRNPYPYYAELRHEAPVLRDVSGAWVLSRYSDVLAMLTSPNTSAARPEAIRRLRSDSEDVTIRKMFDTALRQMLYQDAPLHTRIRSRVSKAFTPSLIKAFEPSVRRTVDQLLDRALRDGFMDVMTQLAIPLPLSVICEMLAIPDLDRAQLKRWSSDYATFLGGSLSLPHETMLQLAQSLSQYMHYFRELSRRRVDQPGDDLLSALLLAEDAHDGLDRESVCATAVLLLFAGHETTTHLIGNGLLALLRKPSALELLRRSPELWPTAIDELLRIDAPVQWVARVLTEEWPIDQHTITRGTVVYGLIGSANRDPERFDDPDQLVLTRTNNRHLAFGQGPHYCIGAALARLEAQIALSTLLQRSRALHASDSELHWNGNPALRGMANFPLRVEPD